MLVYLFRTISVWHVVTLTCLISVLSYLLRVLKSLVRHTNTKIFQDFFFSSFYLRTTIFSETNHMVNGNGPIKQVPYSPETPDTVMAQETNPRQIRLYKWNTVQIVKHVNLKHVKRHTYNMQLFFNFVDWIYFTLVLVLLWILTILDGSSWLYGSIPFDWTLPVPRLLFTRRNKVKWMWTLRTQNRKK